VCVSVVARVFLTRALECVHVVLRFANRTAQFLGGTLEVVGTAIPGIAVLGFALKGLTETAKRAKYNKELAETMQSTVDMIVKNILPSLAPNLLRAAKVRIQINSLLVLLSK